MRNDDDDDYNKFSFDSVADVWKNVMNNMSDFKELVPEFYDTDHHGDFLKNNYGIDFGFRHDGTKINDVRLPPWANGKTIQVTMLKSRNLIAIYFPCIFIDPSDFVQKLRCALESSQVSENLHQWIDLIFGYKQRGDEALKADNGNIIITDNVIFKRCISLIVYYFSVFFHLCYEGAINLDTIKDLNDRHGLEVQIMEFGQIPKQVFKLPHPKRLTVTELLNREICFTKTQVLPAGNSYILNFFLLKY